jgi:hypothetical protein
MQRVAKPKVLAFMGEVQMPFICGRRSSASPFHGCARKLLRQIVALRANAALATSFSDVSKCVISSSDAAESDPSPSTWLYLTLSSDGQECCCSPPSHCTLM